MAWQDMAAPGDQPASTPGWQQNAIPAGQTASSSGPSQSWSDYLLDHLHSFSQGLTAATRVATDAPTFGLMDKAFGPQAQADTAAAYKQMGGAALPLSVAGGLATGGPELKGASMLGEALGGGRLGATLGSGAVGAGTGAAGAYGHEAGWTPDASDIVKGAAIGGALNAGAGAISGPAVEAGQVAGRQFTPRALPAAQTSNQLAARATQEYAPLEEMVFHGPSQVGPALDAVENTMTGAEKDLAKSTMAKVGKLGDQPLVTGADLQSYQKLFGALARTGSDEDRQFAPQFSNALQDVMNNTVPYGRNLTPGQGMSLMLPGPLGGTGLAAGDAAAAKAAGDLWHGRAQDMARLETMQAKAAVTGGPDVGSQQRSFLTSEEGQRFAPPPAPGAPASSAPLYSAGNELAGTAAKADTVPWYVKHFIIAPMLGTGAGELYTGLSGQEHESPLAHLATDATVGLGLMSGMAGYGRVSGALNQAAQQRAIDALKSTISTGAYQAPLAATTPYRNALRMLLLGQSGRY